MKDLNEILKPLKISFKGPDEENYHEIRILIKNLTDVRFKDARVFVHGIDENDIVTLSDFIVIPHIGQAQTVWSNVDHLHEDFGKIATVEITEIKFNDLMGNNYSIEYDITPKFDCKTGELLGEYSVFVPDNNIDFNSEDGDDEHISFATYESDDEETYADFDDDLDIDELDDDVSTNWEYEDAVMARGGDPFDSFDDISGGSIGLSAGLWDDFEGDE